MVVFTTGLGTPTGTPIAPVIKVTANGRTYTRMSSNIDIDLSPVMAGEMTLDEAGALIFGNMVETARGKLTKSEIIGHREFGIYRVGPTF